VLPSPGLRPGEVRLHRDSAPIGHLEGNETAVVVGIANAGVQKSTVGVGARAADGGCRVASGGNWGTLQTAWEVEGTVVQITPEAPDLGIDEISCGRVHSRASTNARSAPVPVSHSLIVDEGLSAAREAFAVACALKRGFKERLWRDGCWALCVRPGAAAARQTGYAPTILHHQIGVGLLKLLAAQRHHVGNRVQFDGLIFVGNSTVNITEFHTKSAAHLTLQSNIDRVDRVRPEIRIQTLGAR